MFNNRIKGLTSKIIAKIDDDGDGSVEMVDIRNKTIKFTADVWSKVIGYLLTAFGLVAGLAWNDAIKSIIAQYYPMSQDGVAAKLVYAIAVTALVVFMTIIFLQLSKTSEDKK